MIGLLTGVLIIAGCQSTPTPTPEVIDTSTEEVEQITLPMEDTDIVISRQDFEDGGFTETHLFTSPALGISVEYEVDDFLMSQNKISRYDNILCIEPREKLETLEDKIGCVQVLPSEGEYTFNEEDKKVSTIDSVTVIEYNPYITMYEAERSGTTFPVTTIKKI